MRRSRISNESPSPTVTEGKQPRRQFLSLRGKVLLLAFFFSLAIWAMGYVMFIHG